MPAIQICGDRRGVGKTSLAGALVARAIASGKSAGYYKPFTTSETTDADVAFFSEDLLASRETPRFPSPVSLPDGAGAAQADALAAQLGDSQAAMAAFDVAMIEGPDLVSPAGESWTLPGKVSESLDSQVLLVLGFRAKLSAETTQSAIGQFGERLSGVILNGVTSHRLRETELGFLRQLQSAGIPVLGMLPEDRGMLAVTVEQIAAHLGGHWVQEPENTDVIVERFLIGGNIMDAGPTYFGRYANQAVVTRAERPDIQLASLMEDTRCLVLTGTGEPTDYIKAEAMQRDVPLIRVEQETLPTVEALAGLLDEATAHSTWKIERFSQLIQRHLDLSPLESIR